MNFKLPWNIFLEITHFGQKYTHQEIDIVGQEPKGRSARELNTKRRSVKEVYEPLQKDILKGLYRHYWLDFVLLGYDIPHELI